MTCFVYFVRAENGERVSPVKVGVASNPENRLRELQCGNHLMLSIKATVELGSKNDAFVFESMVHSKLRKFNSRGEWFIVSPRDIRRAITSLRKDGQFANEISSFVYG